ncbi:hypothetical protein KUTeg_013172 [Tegillarca granosa]|uniref:Triokinase/FMN cyclase n=1 Tax=Tegillarca granosa TaxID=220873 RepID=A0ABQ9ESW7_TEGGR|nr:hypothetical protein KUTeg_013172 [Tegillarca granosa]
MNLKMATVCKKLINSVSQCVDDNLEGLVAVNPGLCLLEGHRVVVRTDVADVIKSGKVTIVCGGGSGHEPAHAGYVGPGMLTAAVAGSVFASPPPRSILAAIRAISDGSSVAGVLVIIKNYTGDRVNFGLAVERAKAEGIKVDMVVVGEDCALTSSDKTAGRRGLCGTVIMHKICGALAEEGRSLEEIVEIARKATTRMGTIGLCLAPCSLPGSGPSFQLGIDEMELGLGDRVACMINNLGGSSVLEMNIIAKEAISLLESRGVIVERAYCGTFVTSLEMAGASITLLHLDDTLRKCLDAETLAVAWPQPLLPAGVKLRQNPSKMKATEVVETKTDKEIKDVLSPVERNKLYDILKKATESIVAAKTELNELDKESGDGDTGNTLSRGAQAILDQLGSRESPGLPVGNPSAVAACLDSIAENVMGGSSGGFYSLLFSSASSVLQQSLSPQVWCDALKLGIQTIMRYGGAEPGDRTMLDPLNAAHTTLASELSMKTDPVQAFRLAVQAADKTAQSTATMAARAGRASYVSKDHLKQADPGAVAVSIWMKAALMALES